MPKSLTVFIVWWAACAPVANMRGPQQLEEKYERELRTWTRSAQIYHSLDSILVTHAVYLSVEFRQAFGEQYLKIFSIDPSKVDTDLEKIATSVGRGHEFFLFADASHLEWNNLEQKDSVWRLGLWGSNEQLGTPPLDIERFEGRGPNLKAFFPFINQFGISYLVVFPVDQSNSRPVIEPDVDTLTLKLASAYGTATMSWKVKR